MHMTKITSSPAQLTAPRVEQSNIQACSTIGVPTDQCRFIENYKHTSLFLSFSLTRRLNDEAEYIRVYNSVRTLNM
jgi:hypothetical protein